LRQPALGTSAFEGNSDNPVALTNVADVPCADILLRGVTARLDPRGMGLLRGCPAYLVAPGWGAYAHGFSAKLLRL
jgi:hypothetical protein